MAKTTSHQQARPGAIILITLDALRADHLGCYGYPLATSPFLDRLAQDSVLFERAFSPVPLTTPSHTSILTGKYPRFHSVGFHNGDKPLSKEQETTLPQILRQLGYSTAAFVSIAPLLRHTGLDSGFDFYDDELPQRELNRPSEARRSADLTTTAVLRWLEEHHRSPFFLWVHYAEPHGPYTPPPPYDSLFVGDPSYGPPRLLEVLPDWQAGGIPTYQVLKPRRDAGGNLLDYEKDFTYYLSQYDGQIRFVDDQLKLLVDRLKDWGIFDDALLIITADHGEALGENDIFFFHGLTVSLEQVHVPLLVRPPSRSVIKSRRITEPVSTVDIMPTVLAWLGQEAQYLGLQGVNLLPLLEDSRVSPPERYIFSEIPTQLSIIHGRFQLLYGKEKDDTPYDRISVTEGLKLFDHITDHSGKHDLSTEYPYIVNKLKRLTEHYLNLPQPVYARTELSELDKEEIEQRLEKLGYRQPEQAHGSDTQMVETGYCVICGRESIFRFDPQVISERLKWVWGISDKLAEAFCRRESMRCSSCGSSLRVRRLCSALIDTLSHLTGNNYNSLRELLQAPEFRCMRIAEINSCGALHDFLMQHPNLCYSEYVPGIRPGETYQGVRCEDLQRLTYPDDYFDIILTSDTLEHVPDPEKALIEIWRTLKPGGFHLFTVPIVPSQVTTFRRARLTNGQLEHQTDPMYHGSWGQADMLVFTEFGMDLTHKLDKMGFTTELLYYNPTNTLDVAFVLRSRKTALSLPKKGEYQMLQWTGERFLPWISGAQIHYEHLHRYAFATQFVKSKKVIDLACGEGYGSSMLASEAEYVVGIEIDRNTVEHARTKYTRNNLEFIQGSILSVPVEGERLFDVAVCFEGIEHVAEHDKLLSEVKRLLKEDGIFVVSTPNKALYSDTPAFNNPYHVKELYLDEFTNLLRRHFKYFQLWGQRVYAGSNIWSIGPAEPAGYSEAVIKRGDREFYLTSRDSKEPMFFVATASDAPLKAAIQQLDSWLVDASSILLKDYEKQIAELTSLVQAKDSQIAELAGFLQAKDSQIAELAGFLQQIQRGIVMQLLKRYQRIVEKLLCPGTRKRYYYELALTGIRVILNEGWKSFLREMRAYIRSKRTRTNK